MSLDPRKYVDHAGAYRKGSPRTNGVDTRLEHKIFQAEKNGLDEMPRVRAFKHPDEKAYRHPEKQAGVKVTAMKYHMHTATYDGKPLVQHSPARRLLENTYNAVGLANDCTFNSPARPPPGSMDLASVEQNLGDMARDLFTGGWFARGFKCLQTNASWSDSARQWQRQQRHRLWSFSPRRGSRPEGRRLLLS